MVNTRYEGKPFLRLLEFYVLWSIGELGEQESTILEEMTPNLRKTYNSHLQWQEIVAEQMELPIDLPGRLKTLWEKNKLIIEEQGLVAEAEVFAQQFVDQNLSQQ